MIISVEVEKSFGKNLAGFHDEKTLKKFGLEGKFLNMSKFIYEKPITNTCHTQWLITKSFPCKIRNGTQIPAFTGAS